MLKRLNCKYPTAVEGGPRNRVSEPVGELMQSDYKAGDLIIFDTDCTHNARDINNGYRLIARTMSKRINQRV